MNHFVMIFVLIFSLTLSAQEYDVRIIKSNSAEYPSIITSVQVFYSGGEPVTGLVDTNFTLLFDKEPVDSLSVVTYEKAGYGLDIVLCLDLSGSVKGEPLNVMKNAVHRFIDEMRDIDKLAIIAYADSASLEADFSNEKSYLHSMVDGLSVSGSQTSLYYGAVKGIGKLLKGGNAGKILIVMGDGKNESKADSYTLQDVIQKANKERIPIFTVGYTKIDAVYLQSLEKMAESTGGNYYYSPDDDQLEKQYQTLYRQIMHIYLLTYSVSLPGDGSGHPLVVQVEKNGLRQTKESSVLVPVTEGTAAAEEDLIEGIPDWAIYAAGGVALLLLLLASVLAVAGSRKKKREQEKAMREEREYYRNRLDDERKKREEAEKEKDRMKNSEAEVKPPPEDEILDDETTLKDDKKSIRNDREKTMILRDDGRDTLTPNGVELSILIGEFKGKSFIVSKEGAAIGKADDNTIVLKDNTVSRHHAKIEFNDGAFLIKDLNSSNGIFINGKKVEQAFLKSDDVFKIGRIEGSISFL